MATETTTTDSPISPKRRKALQKAQQERRKRLMDEGYRGVTVYLPADVIKRMDKLVKKKKYPGRAEVITEAINQLMR